MKHLKRILRVCALIIFMLLAVAGMSLTGIAPTLNRDRKLFADDESKIEMVEQNQSQMAEEDEIKQ